MKKVAKFFRDNLIIILLSLAMLAVFAISLFIGIKQNKESIKNKEKAEMYDKLQDTLKTFKDEKGKLVNQISVLESSNYKYFTDLKTKDSTVLRLQETVNKYKKQLNKPGGTAIEIDRETIIDTIIQKEIEYVYIDGALYLKDSFTDKWISAEYERRKDSSLWKIKAKDDISIAIVEDKGRKYAEVTNHSPYSNTKNLRVWQFEEPKKKKTWGIGIQAGYGVTADNLLQPKPYIGIGISKNLITF